jgi:hypothetical protein
MPATYAFDAETWQQCVGRPVVLSRVFRQKDNGTPHVFIPIVRLMFDGSDFVQMLSAMRVGQLSSRTIAQFRQLSRPLVYDDGIEASML